MKKWIAAIIGIGLCLTLLPAAFAAEYGQPDITADTTLKQLRENPSVAASGILTYGRFGDSYREMTRRMFENETISQYIAGNGEDSAKGLDLAIENYNRDVQVTWQVYTPEEIEQTPARAAVQLFWFPAEQSGSRYAIVLGGNALGTSGELSEGCSAAAQLHQLGYTVFVLRYSIEENRADNAPLNDLARAVQLITEHAGQFDVQTENYALVGFSSGAQICEQGVRLRPLWSAETGRPAVCIPDRGSERSKDRLPYQLRPGELQLEILLDKPQRCGG